MTDRKVAWIVGASSGIGAELAARLADEGFEVAISARRVERLDALAASTPHLHPYPLDAGDAEASAATCARIIAELGGLDLALFAAADWHRNILADYDAARYAAVTRVNYLGAVNMIDPAVEYMKRAGGGEIAVIASVAGYFGIPGGGAYGPAKAALIQLAEMMRVELKGLNIAVRLINPGFVDTELTQRNEFPMPFMMDVHEAGRRIVNGLLRSTRFEIAFPMRFVVLLKLGQMLPYPVFFWLMKRVLPRAKRG